MKCSRCEEAKATAWFNQKAFCKACWDKRYLPVVKKKQKNGNEVLKKSL